MQLMRPTTSLTRCSRHGPANVTRSSCALAFGRSSRLKGSTMQLHVIVQSSLGSGHLHDLRLTMVADRGGWAFQGRQHQNVYASMDFRLAWSLERAAHNDVEALTRLMAIGSDFYSELTELSVFCPGCSDPSTGGRHTAHYRSAPSDGYPSLLALQIRHTPWVSAILDGKPAEERFVPRDVWWAPAYPSSPGLRQSPLRYLKICHPALGVYGFAPRTLWDHRTRRGRRRCPARATEAASARLRAVSP